jgi:hypothetical protein
VRDFFPFLYFHAKQDDPDFTAHGIAKDAVTGEKVASITASVRDGLGRPLFLRQCQ